MYKLYQITNTVNGKSYIGITKLPINERWVFIFLIQENPNIHYIMGKFVPNNLDKTIAKVLKYEEQVLNYKVKKLVVFVVAKNGI